MFNRNLYSELMKWRDRPDRLPLVLRGARQTGKTTLIKEFSRQYESFLYFNCEELESRRVFTESFSETIKLIDLKYSKKIDPSSTLLCIDEIQASPEAIGLLRFFAEEMPRLSVICAGSLLEQRLSQKLISFPTGRVEYAFLTPFSFVEFLQAQGKNLHVDSLKDPVGITPGMHRELMSELSTYFQVGGMPAAVASWVSMGSIAEVQRLHRNLFQSILDDIGRYLTKSESKYIEFVFDAAPYKIGQRIIYGNFNNSEYRTREVKQAFEILQKAFLVYRVLPTASTAAPLFHNVNKSPKLFFFDIGMAGSRLMIPAVASSIAPEIKGRIAEQFVFQEMLAAHIQLPEPALFWTRDTSNSNAEIDFCSVWNGRPVPIEVKSGSAGTLKSLGVFMKESSGNLAIRFFDGLPLVQKNIETGTHVPFTLVNLPLYLAGNWQSALDVLGVR